MMTKEITVGGVPIEMESPDGGRTWLKIGVNRPATTPKDKAAVGLWEQLSESWAVKRPLTIDEAAALIMSQQYPDSCTVRLFPSGRRLSKEQWRYVTSRCESREE